MSSLLVPQSVRSATIASLARFGNRPFREFDRISRPRHLLGTLLDEIRPKHYAHSRPGILPFPLRISRTNTPLQHRRSFHNLAVPQEPCHVPVLQLGRPLPKSTRKCSARLLLVPLEHRHGLSAVARCNRFFEKSACKALRSASSLSRKSSVSRIRSSLSRARQRCLIPRFLTKSTRTGSARRRRSFRKAFDSGIGSNCSSVSRFRRRH